MTSRALKIALAISVAVNIFALTSSTVLWISRERVAERMTEVQKASARKPLSDLVAQLEPATRERVMQTLRNAATQARPDFEEARQARREAIRLTEHETNYRPIEVSGLLERSRASEMRGRARLEAGAVDVLSQVSARDRKSLAPLLARHNHRKSNGTGKGPAEAGAESASRSR